MCALLATLGCTGPTVKPPPVDLEQPFSATGERATPDRWWLAFEDRQLSSLVDRALDSNLTVKSAWQRLREARAVVDRESASLFPDLTLTGQAATESNGTTTFDGDASNDEVRLGLTSEYEVDLWGRISSAVEAERLRAEASLYDYQTATLSIAAEVTRTWYRLLEARRQLRVIDDQIETNRQVLELLNARFNVGSTRRADLLRQRQLLEATRGQRHAAQSRARTLEHRLAVLIGRAPQAGIDYSAKGLPATPPLPRTGVPAELVQRRPDTRSAFNRLRAADRDVAVAISNQFPRLTLTASVSTSDEGADELFENWASAFAADLAAPLLDAGRRAAEVDRARAVERRRLYEYGQSILTAFQEVEDALVQERKQRDRINSLREQMRLARETYESLRQRYVSGGVGYLDVLTALTDVQSLRRDLLTARRQQIEFRIALYRALAGGLETKREREVS